MAENETKKFVEQEAYGVNHELLSELHNYEKQCMSFLDEDLFEEDEMYDKGTVLDRKVDIPTGQGASVVKGPYIHSIRLKINAYDSSQVSKFKTGEYQKKDKKKKEKFKVTNEIIQSLQESYNYFLNDLSQLFSIKECMVSMESTTRKELQFIS